MLERLEHARLLLQKTEQNWSQQPIQDQKPFSLGIPEIEQNFSKNKGFSDSIHEFYSQVGFGGRDFYTAILSRLFLKSDNRIIFWITSPHSGDSGQIYPLSLPLFLQERLHFITPKRERDVLWSFEECLASEQASVVIAEVSHLDLLSSRRLQLACEKGQSLGLALCQNTLGLRQSSAARTRWRVSGAAPRTWKLELLGGHGIRPGSWNVSYDQATFSLSLVPPSRH